MRKPADRVACWPHQTAKLPAGRVAWWMCWACAGHAQAGDGWVGISTNTPTHARTAFDDDAWRGAPPFKQRKYRKYQRVILDAAERVAASDVRIAFGSDYGMFPHRDNWREFSTMVTNGLTSAR